MRTTIRYHTEKMLYLRIKVIYVIVIFKITKKGIRHYNKISHNIKAKINKVYTLKIFKETLELTQGHILFLISKIYNLLANDIKNKTNNAWNKDIGKKKIGLYNI